MDKVNNKIILTSSNTSAKKPLRPAMTSEARENQLISLAMDLVEQRLRDGTATSQEVTHFLKLGSSREKLEQEQLAKNMELMAAKKEVLEATKRYEEISTEALKAMKTYAGVDNQDMPVIEGEVYDDSK